MSDLAEILHGGYFRECPLKLIVAGRFNKFFSSWPNQPKKLLIENFQKKSKSQFFSAQLGLIEFFNCDLVKCSHFFGFADCNNSIFAYFRSFFVVFQPNLHENRGLITKFSSYCRKLSDYECFCQIFSILKLTFFTVS